MKSTLVLVPTFAAILSALLVGASPIPTSDALVARSSHGASGATPPVINGEFHQRYPLYYILKHLGITEPSSTVGQTVTDQVTAVGSPATQQTVSGKTSNADSEDPKKVHEGTHLHVPGTVGYEEHQIKHKKAQLAKLQKDKNPNPQTKEHIATLEREIAQHNQQLAKLQAAPAALGSADATGPFGALKPAGSTTASGSSL
ncbi:hypothetical protein H0H93_006051 [Arthromyces matolae]|nr:hypothetical protein H0H93_006051 [Arthromyces matolae]